MTNLIGGESKNKLSPFQNVLMCVLGAILIKIKASISPYTSNSSLKIILLPYQNHPIKMNSKWVTLLVIICHYFTKKGGGSNFQLFVTIYFVTIRLRREGVWCNLALVTNFPVFNERKLVLGLLDEKVKVKAKKFRNCHMTCDIVSNIRYWTILNNIVQYYLK